MAHALATAAAVCDFLRQRPLPEGKEPNYTPADFRRGGDILAANKLSALKQDAALTAVSCMCQGTSVDKSYEVFAQVPPVGAVTQGCGLAWRGVQRQKRKQRRDCCARRAQVLVPAAGPRGGLQARGGAAAVARAAGAAQRVCAGLVFVRHGAQGSC